MEHLSGRPIRLLACVLRRSGYCIREHDVGGIRFFHFKVGDEPKPHVLNAPLVGGHLLNEAAGCSRHVNAAYGAYINHVMEIHNLVKCRP